MHTFFRSLGVMLYEMIYGMRPFEKHCPITYVKYLDQIYTKYPICETFTSLTEASVHLSTPSSQGEEKGRRQSCPHLPNNITPEISFESLKDTSSSDDSASVNLKIISPAKCFEKIDDPSWKNEIRVGDMKLQIKLRVPTRNLRSQKVSRECRWFFQQLFDPLPWARRDWENITTLATLPWFQRHGLTADGIINRSISPPFVPTLLDSEFAQKLSAARKINASANFEIKYTKKKFLNKEGNQSNFNIFPNVRNFADGFDYEEEKCSDSQDNSINNRDKDHHSINVFERSMDFKDFDYVNEIHHQLLSC